MSGTKLGGQKASKTNKRLHGKNFYKRIGSIGGQNGTTGGFYANPELAKTAGSIGGRISKRGKAHKFTIIRNAHGDKPNFRIKPLTAQQWRTFFKESFPEDYPKTLDRTRPYYSIIKKLELVWGVKFKEVKR